MKAMKKDREERYQSAREMIVDIEKFMRTYSFFPEVQFEPGNFIVNEGDQSEAAYVIMNGEAEVVRSEKGEFVHVRDLTSGDVFGGDPFG